MTTKNKIADELKVELLKVIGEAIRNTKNSIKDDFKLAGIRQKGYGKWNCSHQSLGPSGPCVSSHGCAMSPHRGI